MYMYINRDFNSGCLFWFVKTEQYHLSIARHSMVASGATMHVKCTLSNP